MAFLDLSADALYLPDVLLGLGVIYDQVAGAIPADRLIAGDCTDPSHASS